MVEVAGSPAGGYTGRLFAGWGASVTLVGRRTGTHPSVGAFLDPAKRPLAADDPALDELLERADVVIESASPDPLTPVTTDREGLVRIEISPFGSHGPYARWRSTDLTDQAIAGHLFLNGDPDREPVAGPRYQVAYAAGLHGFIGAVAAHWGGLDGTVEVTHHEVMTSLHQFTLLRWLNSGDVLGRHGNRFAGPGSACGLYHCLDGHVSLIIPRDDQLERALAVTDGLHLLDEPGITHPYDLMHHPTLLEDHVRQWFATQRVADAVTTLQEVRVPAGPARSLVDLLADEHLGVRGFWRHLDGITHPGPPAIIDDLPWQMAPTSQPAEPQPASPQPAASRGDERADAGAGGGAPLAGLRVVDLTRVWAGPLATRILADLGADVVMVEAPWNRGGPTIDEASVRATHYYPNDEPGPDHWNRIGFVNKFATNKRAVSLDLSKPGGIEALEGLLATADVVIENFSPRVMPQLGLDEARLAELNPALVYVTMPGYGRTGPDTDKVAYGPVIDSHAGLSAVMGYPGETVRKGGIAWPDPVAGMHAAAGALAALQQRAADREPRLRTVEVAQLEACVNMIGHALVDLGATATGTATGTGHQGRQRPGPGSRSGRFAPQGAYPCAGDDRWIAISVVDDDSWAHLAEQAGLDELVGLDREERHRRHDEIDERLAAWTGGADLVALAHQLQAIGVAAAPVVDAPLLAADPHLAARDAFVTVEHPSAGPETWPATPIHFVGRGRPEPRPAGRLGEHNHEVLVGEVGLGEARYRALLDSGALAERPPD